MNQKKYFDRDYTVEQLDCGEDMKFHPCDGKSGFHHSLKYDLESHRFFLPSKGCYGSPTYARRISNGAEMKKGNPYPSHWTYDPFTGEKFVINCVHRDYMVEQLDRGEDMKFHPCQRYTDGEPIPIAAFSKLKDVHYDENQHTFFFHEGWGVRGNDLPRISDGIDMHKGTPYLPHWITDPFTGERLK